MKKDIFDEYASSVARKFNITKAELFSKSKRQDIVDARQMLYYLCYNRPMQPQLICRYMARNGYDTAHTTIIRGVGAMEAKIKDDPDYANMANKIDNTIATI